MQVVQENSNDLLVSQLPDGSKVIVDSKSETVFALNATAGAAWDACKNPTTISKVAEQMQRSFDSGVTEEIAEQAVLQLQEKKLVKTSETSPKLSRREVIVRAGAIALPLVVSLTLADQKAFAEHARSGNSRFPPPPPSLRLHWHPHFTEHTDSSSAMSETLSFPRDNRN